MVLPFELGLPGMLKSFDLRDRSAPLTVFGPPGTEALLDQLRRTIFGRLKYRSRAVDLEPDAIVEFDGYEIHALRVRHRGEAYGYALIEDDRPGRFDAELAARLGVTPGPDFGRLQRGETVGGVAPGGCVLRPCGVPYTPVVIGEMSRIIVSVWIAVRMYSGNRAL